MLKRTLTAVAIGAALIHPAHAQRSSRFVEMDESTVTRTLAFAAGGSRRLDVRNIHGFIHVEAANDSAVQMSIRKEIRAETREDLAEAQRDVRLEFAEGAARVTFGTLAFDYSSLLRRNLTAAAILRGLADGFGGKVDNAADVYAAILVAARVAGSLRYLDLTWNGELTADVRRVLEGARDSLANRALQVPAKVRTGPSDYHSTEQGETDGPRELVSLRLVAERHEPVAAGTYDVTMRNAGSARVRVRANGLTHLHWGPEGFIVR